MADANLDDALRTTWIEVESRSPDRVSRGVTVFRALVPRAIVDRGERSDEHCSALLGLAHGLAQMGEQAESREMYGVLADVHDARVEASLGATESSPGDPHSRLRQLDLALHARALSLVLGWGASDSDLHEAGAVLPALEALVARSERELGAGSDRTIALLTMRAQVLTRSREDGGLEAYDLVIARAAAADEGQVNHLAALAAKATELSRRNRDDEAALLFERVLEGRRALLGMDHADTLDAWWWYTRTLAWSHEEQHALRELDALVPSLQRVYGEDAELTLAAMRFFVRMLQSLGNEHDDAQLIERALGAVRRICVLETARFGPESRQVLASRGQAVDLLNDLNRNAEARGESASLFAEALDVLGPSDPLLVSLGMTRQFVLLALRNELRRGGGEAGTLTDEVAAEGIEAAEQLCEIALAQALTAVRDGEPDASDRVRALGRVVQRPGTWWQGESQERIHALERWADRLAVLGEDDLRDQPVLIQAEINLRDPLADACFRAEALERALDHYKRSLTLERRLAVVPGHEEHAGSRIAQSIDRVASSLRRLGRAAEAETLLAQAIGDAENAGVSTAVLYDLRNTRSLVLQELGRNDEAASEGLALWEASGDPGRGLDLAAIYVNANRHAEAAALLSPLLARLESEGKGHSGTALGVRGNLGLVACAQNRHAEAAVIYDELIEQQRDVLGSQHRDTLTTMHNRALEERHLNNYPESVRRFTEVARLRAKHLGERDPQTLSSLYNLAGVCEQAGNIAQAGPLLQRVATMSLEVLGASHPRTLKCLGDLRRFTERWGAIEAGEGVTPASLPSDTSLREAGAVSGGAHAVLRYADSLLEQDRPGDALIEYAKARDALAADGGLSLLAAERGVAAAHRNMGNHREAAEAFARVVPQIEQQLPADPWALANALTWQGVALTRLGRIDEMIAVRRRAIDVADRAGSDVDRAVWLRLWLGRALREHRRDESPTPSHEEGLAVHLEALQIAKEKLGAEHTTTLEAADDVAEALAELGRHREALRIYRTNIPAMESALGKDSTQVTRARKRQKTLVDKSKGKLQSIVGAVAILGIIGAILWGEHGEQLMSGDSTVLLVLGIGAVAVAIPAVALGLVLRSRLRKRQN